MADEVTLQRVLHDARRDELIDASEADSRKWRIVTHRHLIGSVAGFAIGLGVFMKHRVRVWPALRVAVACKVAEMTVTRVNFEVVRRDTSWHPGEHSYSYFEYNPFSADEVNMVSRRELSYRLRGISSVLNGIAIGCVFPLLVWRPSSALPPQFLQRAASKYALPPGIRV